MTGIHPIDVLKWILGLGGPQCGESHLFLKVLWADGPGGSKTLFLVGFCCELFCLVLAAG